VIKSKEGDKGGPVIGLVPLEEEGDLNCCTLQIVRWLVVHLEYFESSYSPLCLFLAHMLGTTVLCRLNKRKVDNVK
jgi:hypothetical protein